MFERRRQEVQQSLEHLVGSDKALEELTDRLREAPGRIPRGQIKTLLQEVLKELSDDVLRRFNVGERELFRPIISERDRWLWWLNQCMSEDRFDSVVAKLVATYVEGGASAADLSVASYLAGACKRAAARIARTPATMPRAAEKAAFGVPSAERWDSSKPPDTVRKVASSVRIAKQRASQRQNAASRASRE